MGKKVSAGTTVFLVLLACLVTLLATSSVMNKYNYQRDAESALGSMERYEEVKALIDQYYVGELDSKALEDGLIRGLLYGTGDKYAGYYPPEEAEDRYDDLNGNMVGIGVTVVYNADMGAIEIIKVYEGSPAMEAGLLAGDLVVKVGEDGKYVSELGYNAAVNMLRGEEGTNAVFTVYRRNAEAADEIYDELNFTVPRKAIDVETVTYRLYSLDSTVGIIKIDSFDKDKTPAQFTTAVDALRAAGAQKLVMDVRFNPGGELTSVCAVLDYLLPEGPVIRTIDRDGNETVDYMSDANELDMPMAVIANDKTASAGELFTAALKDYGKAKVVGTTTYGKGCMQSYFNLSDGSSLCLTVRLYCPPFSDNYDGVGITPDVEVEICDELKNVNSYKYTDELDNQLAAAVATFN